MLCTLRFWIAARYTEYCTGISWETFLNDCLLEKDCPGYNLLQFKGFEHLIISGQEGEYIS